MASFVARQGASLSAGNFIPEIWSRKMNVKFYAASTCMAICNTKWEGEIADVGSKVIIRSRPTIIVFDYVVNGTIPYQDLADDKVELLINKAKGTAFKADDVDKKQADIKFVNESTMDAAEQVKVTIDKDVLGTVYADATTTLTNTNVTKLTVLDWIVDATVALDQLNIPPDGRWLTIPPWVRGLIMKSDLKDASISGDGTSILRNGRIGIIAGFEIFVSNNLSGTGAASGTPTYCMAGTKDAVAFASQFVKTETLRLQNSFGDAVRSLNVYGYKTVFPDALVSMPGYK